MFNLPVCHIICGKKVKMIIMMDKTKRAQLNVKNVNDSSIQYRTLFCCQSCFLIQVNHAKIKQLYFHVLEVIIICVWVMLLM